MIKKLFEINKNFIKNHNFYLFYGANEGSKNEKINEIIIDVNKENLFNYTEDEILNNENSFLESILNRSLFEKKKVIIIKRVTGKILHILEKMIKKNVDDLIIINSGVLDKKSKLRNYFEKEKKLICVAFYQDDSNTLSKIANKFFSENKISLSQSNINLIMNKCNGDRGVL